MSKYGVFFWPVFSCIRTKYRDLLGKSLYLVWMQENTDQKKLRIWTLFMQQCDIPKLSEDQAKLTEEDLTEKGL